MIIKYDKLGTIIATYPESYGNIGEVGKVQVTENGKVKYQEGDIRTLTISGEIARNYEDPRKPHFNIHRVKVIVGEDKNGHLEDKQNKLKIHFKRNEEKIGVLEKVDNL